MKDKLARLDAIAPYISAIEENGFYYRVVSHRALDKVKGNMHAAGFIVEDGYEFFISYSDILRYLDDYILWKEETVYL